MSFWTRCRGRNYFRDRDRMSFGCHKKNKQKQTKQANMCGPRLHFRAHKLSFCTRGRGRMSLGAIKKRRTCVDHEFISGILTSATQLQPQVYLHPMTSATNTFAMKTTLWYSEVGHILETFPARSPTPSCDSEDSKLRPRCELRIGRVSESNRCYTVRKGLWEGLL